MSNEELCIMYQQGNKDALEKLYTQNSGMIEKIVRRYAGIEDPDDLRQEAYFGIVKAADLWDPEKGVQFMSYAGHWIQHVIRRYIDNCGAGIRVPVHRRELLARYSKTLNSFRAKYGREPSKKEMCMALELTPEQLEDLRKDAATVQVASTSTPISDEADGLTLEDTIKANVDQYEEVLDRIQRDELAREIWSCVDCLKDEQRDVIRNRYREGYTPKECGAALGVSAERVRAVEAQAIRELRKPKHAKRLRPYLSQSEAYSAGLKNIGVGSFERLGSSQEVAMIRLENMSGMSLWRGKELIH